MHVHAAGSPLDLLQTAQVCTACASRDSQTGCSGSLLCCPLSSVFHCLYIQYCQSAFMLDCKNHRESQCLLVLSHTHALATPIHTLHGKQHLHWTCQEVIRDSVEQSTAMLLLWHIARYSQYMNRISICCWITKTHCCPPSPCSHTKCFVHDAENY